MKYKNATSAWDSISLVPYIYYGDQWVTYDNEKSVALKVGNQCTCIKNIKANIAWNVTTHNFIQNMDVKRPPKMYIVFSDPTETTIEYGQ